MAWRWWHWRKMVIIIGVGRVEGFQGGETRMDGISNESFRGSARVLTAWKQSEWSEIQMVWTRAEERCCLYFEKNGEDGAVRQDKKRRFMVYGYIEGRYAGGWHDRGRCRGQNEMESGDLVWRPLMGAAWNLIVYLYPSVVCKKMNVWNIPESKYAVGYTAAHFVCVFDVLFIFHVNALMEDAQCLHVCQSEGWEEMVVTYACKHSTMCHQQGSDPHLRCCVLSVTNVFITHIPANMSATCLNMSIELKYHLEDENIDFKRSGRHAWSEASLYGNHTAKGRKGKRNPFHFKLTTDANYHYDPDYT